MEHVQLFFTTGNWWLITLVAVAAATIGWLTYSRTTPSLPTSARLGLAGLRTIGILTLALALFEPVMRWVLSTEERPRVVVAVDRSASMTRRDAAMDRLAVRDSVLGVIKGAAERHWTFVSFAEGVELVEDVDTIGSRGDRTDLSRVLQWVGNQPVEQRPAAIVFITDGQMNSGEPPLGLAASMGVGVYSIGIGDTVPPVDAVLHAALIPGVTIVDEPTPVNVIISGTGMDQEQVQVELLEEGTVVDTDTAQILPGKIRTPLRMQWTPRVAGTRKLTARLRTSIAEATTSNNQLQEFVEVRSSKRIIYLLAGAPSPDVSFILNALSEDPNVEVRTSIQKAGGEYYDRLPTANEISEAELCILVGYPIGSTDRTSIEQVARAVRGGTGVLFIPSKDVDYGRLGPLEELLPFTVAATRPVEFRATPDVQRGSTSDPILKITGTEADLELWNTLPPVFRTETFVTPRPGASVLATLKVNNVPLAEPLIIKHDLGERRSLAIMGYGLWRWELLGEGPQAARGQAPVEMFRTLMSNAASWLAVADDDKRVRIRTSRRVYGAGEQILILDTVLDEALQPVDNASVQVRISGNGDVKDVVLASIGSGRYRSITGPLPPGDYQFSGSARAEELDLGSDQGRFMVGNLSLEDMATTMNADMLRSLAASTGGVFTTPDAVDRVIEALSTDARMRPIASTTEEDETLWHTPWPLALALTAFSFEWFWRKRRGLL